MIEFRRVGKRFGGKVIFDDFSLSVASGERTCVFGRSGCGKTTLLRLALGLETADSGEILMPKGFRPTVVFQEDRLLPQATLLDNVKFVGADDAAARKFLDAVSLAGEAKSRPSSISGGMKRRAALARALALPDWTHIFLDEPFAGQDAATKAALISLLKRELAGKTALVVTHDKDDAAALGARVVEL